MDFSTEQLQQEQERLLVQLMDIDCEPDRVWSEKKCQDIAPLTLEINQLKKEKDAIILAHSYVYPEIIYGVADVVGDSYYLAKQAKELKAKNIIFVGVVFMAETAKILNPQAHVYVPDIGSGCSLADSLSAEELTQLKEKHPNATVVCYINSNADVKALSDVCVTSSNVYEIVANLPNKEILFVPDKLMAINVQDEMNRRGVEKMIHHSEGTCIVHEEFDVQWVKEQKQKNPYLKIVSHPECTGAITGLSDFVGSTSKMMEYVENTKDADQFMILSECGLVGRLQHDMPEKNFTASCRLCPYMKKNELEKIKQVLISPSAEQTINLNEDVRIKAKTCIDEMFRLT